MRQWLHGHMIEGASRAGLARSIICLTIFSRCILARLGLFAFFVFGVPSFLCFSLSVASPLFRAARPRCLSAGSRLHGIFVPCCGNPVGCLLGVGGTPGFTQRHKHEALFCLRPSAQFGIVAGSRRSPCLSAGSFLSPDLVVFVSTLYFSAPRRWIRRDDCL
jgi:hypothetical protein